MIHHDFDPYLSRRTFLGLTKLEWLLLAAVMLLFAVASL